FDKSVKELIKNEIVNQNKINYLNVKIINCMKFIEYSGSKIYKLSETSIKIDDFLQNGMVKKANTYDEVFIYLLPDFFDVHFCYVKKTEKEAGGNIIELSQMSSGEQQLYNSLSYVIYHIKNAQSNKNGIGNGSIPYKYFNLIFDEAELYYHPEFQRSFIKNIVEILKRSCIDVKGINILVVTHSPFILSDIMEKNILALENGKKYSKLNRTLAANIYDLLSNQFFMTSTIGECSKEIIENIIKYCSEKKKDSLKQEMYSEIIKDIGDEFLNSALTEMIEEKKDPDNNNFIERKRKYYENKIKHLPVKD
ncbi:MAG: AAA family ATPase, partial [Sphaerochaetaceae bacterium]|nr:AAA family ATPase [Sphaerochaetaceae bacterium]